jgi:UDP-N-acetylmuramoyl-tripeptide--D-alanyl-D-alanine ligase
MAATNQSLQNSSLKPIWDSKSLSEALSMEIPSGLIINSVSIDSRTIATGAMFIGIKGETHNGNLFAIDALKKGAAICIVDENIPGLDEYMGHVVMVENSLEALRKLAIYARNRTRAKIIGVTGSVGKTSTKEILKVALASQGEVYASEGNLNNHFGLPLCLANMHEDLDYGIFELGMNHTGEMRELTNIVRPDIAIITTIEAVHLEFFSSVSAIAEAKAEIFESMAEGAVAIINYDNPYHLILAEKAKHYKLKVISFGSGEKLDFILESYKPENESANVVIDAKGKIIEYTLHVVGKQHALNSVAALAAVSLLGADVEFAAQKGLNKFRLQSGRGQIKHNNKLDITIIDDTYNASPASVKAALDTLGNMKSKGRLLAVLGDMRELGERGKELHIELNDRIKANSIDKVFCVGDLMKNLFDVLPPDMRGCYTSNAKAMAEEILSYIEPGDIILVKGSRSIEMEKVINSLTNG